MTKQQRNKVYEQYEALKKEHGKDLVLVIPAQLWDDLEEARREDYMEMMAEIDKEQ